MSSQRSWAEVLLTSELADRQERMHRRLSAIAAWYRVDPAPGRVVITSPPDDATKVALRLDLTGEPNQLEEYIANTSVAFEIELSTLAPSAFDIVAQLDKIVTVSSRIDQMSGEAPLSTNPDVAAVLESLDPEQRTAIDLILGSDSQSVTPQNPGPGEMVVEIGCHVEPRGEGSTFALLTVLIDPSVTTSRWYKQDVWGPAKFTVTRTEGVIRISAAPGKGSKKPMNTASVLTTNRDRSVVLSLVQNLQQASSTYECLSVAWIEIPSPF